MSSLPYICSCEIIVTLCDCFVFDTRNSEFNSSCRMFVIGLSLNCPQETEALTLPIVHIVSSLKQKE